MSNVRTAKPLLRQRFGPRRLLRRGWPIALALLLDSGSAQAGEIGSGTTTPGWLQLETDLSVNPEVLDTRWSSVVRLPSSAPDYSLASAEPLASWSTWSRVPALIEITPNRLAAAEPQVYFRPQFALGGRSESLRSWLRVAGLDATSCMAPLMKMHSSFAGASAHANVSVSARCSFH